MSSRGANKAHGWIKCAFECPREILIAGVQRLDRRRSWRINHNDVQSAVRFNGSIDGAVGYHWIEQITGHYSAQPRICGLQLGEIRDATRHRHQSRAFRSKSIGRGSPQTSGCRRDKRDLSIKS